MKGVVLERAAGIYRVQVDDVVLDATLRGRIKKDDKGSVVPGDEVTIASHSDGGATIEEVAERRSVLKRRSPGQGRGVRTVAANLDGVVAVGAATQPTWNPLMMDRFVAVASANQLPVSLVVNKIDLVDDADDLIAPYRRIGYPVFATSAATSEGTAELKKAVQGKTTLFTGSTGVGKSSLLNTIEPGLALRTRAVSQKSRTGRHTTVASIMCPLSDGGFVVDTPGLRDVSLWGLEPDEVADAFPEIRDTAAGCRFDDCAHREEPDCAVREAVTLGGLAATRLQSFHALLEEAADAARPWS